MKCVKQAPPRFMKKVLVGCFFILLIFTATVIAASFHGVDITDSLIYSFFGAFGIEATVSAMIKMKENTQKSEEEHEYDSSGAHENADEQQNL